MDRTPSTLLANYLASSLALNRHELLLGDMGQLRQKVKLAFEAFHGEVEPRVGVVSDHLQREGFKGSEFVRAMKPDGLMSLALEPAPLHPLWPGLVVGSSSVVAGTRK